MIVVDSPSHRGQGLWVRVERAPRDVVLTMTVVMKCEIGDKMVSRWITKASQCGLGARWGSRWATRGSNSRRDIGMVRLRNVLRIVEDL